MPVVTVARSIAVPANYESQGLAQNCSHPHQQGPQHQPKHSPSS